MGGSSGLCQAAVKPYKAIHQNVEVRDGFESVTGSPEAEVKRYPRADKWGAGLEG